MLRVPAEPADPKRPDQGDACGGDGAGDSRHFRAAVNMGVAEERRERLARMRLYLITGDQGDEVETARIVEAALEGGANVIQLRKKTMPKGEQYAIALALRRLTLLQA